MDQQEFFNRFQEPLAEKYPDRPGCVAGSGESLAEEDGGLQGRYERFKEFHRENPGVYKLFRMFSEQARQAGRQRFGARMIWERIRWYTMIETTSEDYKLNDHYAPYYARLLMLDSSEFEEFFEIRDARFDVSLETMEKELLQAEFSDEEGDF